MTLSPRAQAVLQAVRAACPETMELKFGCRILIHRKSGDEEMVFKGDVETLQHNYHELRTSGCSCCSVSFCKEQCEIFGSELRLEHLLRALRYGKNDGKPLAISQSGGLLRIVINGEWEPISIKYDLTLSLEDNLKNDELVEFVHPLLCDAETP